MNPSVFYLSLDVNREDSQGMLPVKRGDTARELVISLCRGGEAYVPDPDCLGVFTARKADGKLLYQPCTLDEGRIRYVFTEQTAAAPGELLCELRLYDGKGGLLTAPRFSILVSDTVYHDGDLVDSSHEFSALTQLVEETKAIKEAWQQLLDSGLSTMTMSAALRAFDQLLQQRRQEDPPGLPVADPDAKSGWSSLEIYRTEEELRDTVQGGMDPGLVQIPTLGKVDELLRSAMSLGAVDVTGEYHHALGAAVMSVREFLWTLGPGNYVIRAESGCYYLRAFEGEEPGEVTGRLLWEVLDYVFLFFYPDNSSYESTPALMFEGDSGKFFCYGKELGAGGGLSFDSGFVDDGGYLHLTQAGEEAEGFTPFRVMQNGEKDVTASYEEALIAGEVASARQYLWTLAPGRYYLEDTANNVRYHLQAFENERGGVQTRQLFISGDFCSIEYTSQDEPDGVPELRIEGDSGDIYLRGASLATRDYVDGLIGSLEAELEALL